MNEYRPIYSLSIEHDYYMDKACRSIDIRVSPPGVELMRRRGLLFRQMAINEWAILSGKTNASMDTDIDVLTFDMYLSDPTFVLFTEWQAFEPQKAYSLHLPMASPETVFEISGKRGIGSGFCRAQLHFTKEMSTHDTLVFHAKKQYWEYFFVARNEHLGNGGRLTLKEAKGELAFSTFEPVELLGRKAWRTISAEPVALRERYGYSLSLFEEMPDAACSHIVRMKNLPHPVAGSHLGGQDGFLRQICYF